MRGSDERKIMWSPRCPFHVFPVLLVLFYLPPLNIHAQLAVYQEMRLTLQIHKHRSCDHF